MNSIDKQKLFRFSFGCDSEILPETVIVTPFFSTRRFADNDEVTARFKGKMYSGIVAEESGNKYAVIRCGIGDRLMGDAVLLLEATRVQNVIFVGTCGALKDCEIGDILLCGSAFDGEGFSRYNIDEFSMEKVFHAGRLVASNPEYTDKLRDFLSAELREKPGFKAGDVFTIGSLLAEGKDNLDLIKEKGFAAVDMELSAVYQAANVIGRRATGLLVVSDLPMSKPFWEGLAQPEETAYDKGIENVVRICVDFISRGRK